MAEKTKITTLAQLTGAGALMGGEPTKALVEWENDAGDKIAFNILIKPLSFGAALDFGANPDKKTIAQAISQLILLDDGDGGHEQMSYEQALMLHPQLGWRLFEAISGAAIKKK